MRGIATLRFIILSLLLVSCEERADLAPVDELRWHSPHDSTTNSHQVRPGETLFAIAFRYDTDYRQLARLNQIPAPYLLRVGQRLLLHGAPPMTRSNAHPPRQTIISRPSPPVTYQARLLSWRWPVRGKVTSRFAPQQGRKGIDIACAKGSWIRSTASGVVAYAGSGLLGYGNLIIIKHNNDYLTAYGNNARNLVAEGARVNAGQIIAEAGLIDRHYWGVHFEIRKKGIPVNPLNYLQKG